MGTDIHLEVEQWDGSAWKIVDAPASYPRDPWDLKEMEECRVRGDSGKGRHPMFRFYEAKVQKGWPSSRNYLWFAVLAGVRNGFGFAGTKTHTPIKPMSAPKGLPEDRDRSAELGVDEYGCTNEEHYGDHSFSYLTLEEMLAYPEWETRFEQTALCTRSDYEKLTDLKWDHMSSPYDRIKGLALWNDVTGPNIVKIDERSDEIQTADWNHILMYWSDSIATRLTEFRGMMLAMAEMVEHPKDIRIVFGFDS